VEIKILVRTPPGQAKEAAKNIKFALLGLKKVKKVYCTEEDDQICLEYEGSPREILKISRNVDGYKKITEALKHKMPKKTIMAITKSDEQTYDAVISAMSESTSLEVIKTATAEELSNQEDSIFSKMKNGVAKVFHL